MQLVLLILFSWSVVFPTFSHSHCFVRLDLFSIQLPQPWNFVAQERGKTVDHRDGTEATTAIGDNRSFQEQQVIQFCFAEEEESKDQEGINRGESCQECKSVNITKQTS